MIFRYPGGKGKLVKKFIHHIPEGQPGFADVFVGGGSVALRVANRAADKYTPIFLNDKDYWVASFWEVVANGSDSQFNELLKLVKVKPTIEMFRERRAKFHPEDFSKRRDSEELDAAFNALFFNRTTFSGILSRGPIGTDAQRGRYLIDCRWERPEVLAKEISSARELLRGRTTVRAYDFKDFIHSLPNDVFLYVDPPYVKAGDNLYGTNLGPTGHKDLCQMLSTRSSWLLSYGNHDDVRRMYREYRIEELTSYHSLGSGDQIGQKECPELLIFSKGDDMPEQVDQKPKQKSLKRSEAAKARWAKKKEEQDKLTGTSLPLIARQALEKEKLRLKEEYDKAISELNKGLAL